MNLLQLVFKQMRQRALSTWLTMLSVTFGVALVVAILVLRRESGALFGQSEFGYEAIVGVKGSPLQLTLNTVYQLDRSPGNIKWSVYEELMQKRTYRADIRFAFPVAVGDSYKGRRIVGAKPQMFGFGDDGQPLAGYDGSGRLMSGYENPNVPPSQRNPSRPVAGEALEYRLGKKYTIAQGRMFHGEKFEAVIGADVTKLTGLKLGEKFHATHGLPAPKEKPDVHEEEWTVVGILDKTHTAADGVVYIPLTSFYTIFEHGEGELDKEYLRKGWNPATRPKAKPDEHEHEAKHYTVSDDGVIKLDPEIKDALEISALFIKARGPFNASNLIYNINLRDDVMAVNPAETMRTFFQTFLAGSSIVLLLIAILVTIVAAVGILVSIYNAISARLREIAILRALGATRTKVLGLICMEAGLIGLLGGLLGMLLGHGLAAGGSVFLQSVLGEGINWASWDKWEWLYLAGVVVISLLAGLAPAMKAYRTPVATNLVAG
jgi:putative ABC transport system permease protein